MIFKNKYNKIKINNKLHNKNNLSISNKFQVLKIN